ncbi:MAG: hypothetical protein DID90_2727553734 [Candidatus Nitrotoga sp. LAW]|nr:MAG: hypothetical protein DID90_2727553734 [Candidatus Nitrotoga sp. LAW]
MLKLNAMLPPLNCALIAISNGDKASVKKYDDKHCN